MRTIRHRKYLGLGLISMIIMAIAVSCDQKERNNHSHGDIFEVKPLYTCSMHPQIIRDKPGQCPICGMNLTRKVDTGGRSTDRPAPTNEYSIISVPLTTIHQSTEEIPIKAIGNIQNDTRELATISAKVTGRIEKLYVRYRYQMIMPGDRIMEIYSPELATAQQNLLFLLENDDSNASLIAVARQRLLLMGMSDQQLQQLIKARKPFTTISVYSNVIGHVHEAGQERMDASTEMQSASTQPLAIREGQYVQAGQKVFYLTNPRRAWAVLNIFPENQHMIKIGDPVKIMPETMPQKAFTARIDLIEPAYRQGSKTLTARVYFDNDKLEIPIGSQVRAKINKSIIATSWLPQEAVLSLGLNEVVFVKTGDKFTARKVQTGIRQNDQLQIINGLSAADSVAANAGFLYDSDSFIKLNQ